MGKLHYRGTTHSQLPSNFFTPPEHLITLTHAHLLTYTHINTRARARARAHTDPIVYTGRRNVPVHFSLVIKKGKEREKKEKR